MVEAHQATADAPDGDAARSSLLAPRSSSFSPPTAEQLQAHLDANPLQPPTAIVLWLPLLALVAIAVLALGARSGPVAFLPWVALLVMVWFNGRRLRRARRVEQRLAEAQELAMLRRWPQSLALAWALVERAAVLPEAYGRAVALIGHNLDQAHAYDAAIVAYDFLLERMPADHLGAVQLRAQRTIAELMTERLADADDSLRRLRGWLEGEVSTAKGPVILTGPNITTATVRLVQLIQQMKTNHDEDAAGGGPAMLEALRPLGVEAAYGHALLALSNYRLHQATPKQETPPPDAPDRLRNAGLWWSKATLLMPVAALVERFSELAVMAVDPVMVKSQSPSTPWYKRRSRTE